MQYFIVFLEGIVTFLSPCLLPMLPIYVSYFAGGDEQRGTKRTLLNALGFVIGFTLMFTLLGLFAGSLGKVLSRYQTLLNLITGAIVVLFGLSMLKIIRLPQLSMSMGQKVQNNLGFFSAILFGLIFSLSWTPCVGAFLGSALALASQQGSAIQGAIMLLLYSAGLGLPFMLSALLVDWLKVSFAWIKRHYGIVNVIAGSLLVLIGLAMMSGYLNKLLSILS